MAPFLSLLDECELNSGSLSKKYGRETKRGHIQAMGLSSKLKEVK